MSEHDTSMRESEKRATIADALRLKSAQRSWRAIEAAGRDADFVIVTVGGKARADQRHGPDCDDWREEGDKVRMQCAASVDDFLKSTRPHCGPLVIDGQCGAQRQSRLREHRPASTLNGFDIVAAAPRMCDNVLYHIHFLR
jgi:hypothetical protein